MLVNPTKITVHSVEAGSGLVLRPDYSYYVPPTATSETVKPRPIYGYFTPADQVVSLNPQPAEVILTFEFTKMTDAELGESTAGYRLEQRYSTPEEPAPIEIGKQMVSRVYLDVTGFSATLVAPVIVIDFDEEMYDPQSIIVAESDSINSWRVASMGRLEITLYDMGGGSNIDFPIIWRFRKYSTPENTYFPLNASLEAGGLVRAVANEIRFAGWYDDPWITKSTDGQPFDGVVLRKFDPSDIAGEETMAIDAMANGFVPFTFELLEVHRNIGPFVITDVLPKYMRYKNGAQTEELAVFDPALNPEWTLSEDGLSVTYNGNALNRYQISVPMLKLRFPYARYGANIINTVRFELTPFNLYPNENTMVGKDTISFHFSQDPTQGHVFVKLMFSPRYDDAAEVAYFYDTDYDRNRIYSWSTFINTRIGGTLRNVTLSDYSLDARLYYTGVEVPTQFVGSEMRLIDNTGTIFKTMIIGNERTNFSRADGLNTKRIEISTPLIPAGYLHEILFLTALIDPDNTHYGSANLFENKASLSYDSGPSHFDVEDFAPLNLRSINQKVRPQKDQWVAEIKGNDMEAYRNQAVTYELSVFDQTYLDYSTYRDHLKNFYMLDLLPLHLTLNRVTLSNCFAQNQPGGTGTPGSYRVVNNYRSSGRTAIIFETPLLLNTCKDIAKIETTIDADAPEGGYQNDLYMDFSNTNVENINQQVYPAIDPVRTFSFVNVRFFIASPYEVSARKAIRINSTDPWTPVGVYTPANAPFEYQLLVLNDLDTPRTQVSVVDVLPYIGDTSITMNNNNVRTPRESMFQNRFDLTRTVGVNLPGATISYFNSDSPFSYGASTEGTLDNLAWQAAPATNTRAIRVEVPTIPARSSLIITIPMLAPDNPAPDFPLSGLRAYNTFVRRDDTTRESSGLRYLEPNRVWNEIPEPIGSIRLHKVSNATPAVALPGAGFRLYNAADEFLAEGTTNATGDLLFSNLPLGMYTIREVTAPAGFALISDPIIVTREQMFKAPAFSYVHNVVNAPKPPDPILGSISIQKLDSTGANLPGVGFHISQMGVFDQTVYTGANGRIIVNDLPAGTYTISEVVPPPNINPAPNKSCTITASNRVCDFTGASAFRNDKLRLVVNKISVPADFNKPITDVGLIDGSLLAGVSLGIWNLAGTSRIVGPVSSYSGEYVFTHTNLVPNTRYRLREEAGVAGYSPFVGDIIFLVTPTGQLKYQMPDGHGGYTEVPFLYNQITIPNNRIRQTGLVRVQKQDGNGAPLGGVTFTIFKQQADETWAIHETFTTDAAGLGQSQSLPHGNYRLQETATPLGYMPDVRVQSFYIAEYPTAPADLVKTFTYTYTNYRLQMSLMKAEMIQRSTTYGVAVSALDALRQGSCPSCRIVTTNFFDASAGTPADTIVHIVRPLPGAEFELSLNGTVLHTGPTDANGMFNLPPGFVVDVTATYTLREITPPAGYRPVPGSFNIRIGDYTTMPGFNGQIRIGVENQPILGLVSVSKYNRPGMIVLPGVTFQLTPINTSNPAAVATTKVTNNDGYATWTNLPLGTYELQEIATVTGYDLDNTVYPITISEAQTSHYVVAYNNQSIRDIQVVKVKYTDPLVLPPEYLAGATFELYRVEAGVETVVDTQTTDANGLAIFQNVAYGVYYVREIAAPPGYRLNFVPVEVTLDATTPAVVSFTVKDSASEQQLPDTGTPGSLAFLLLGIGLLGLAVLTMKKRQSLR